MMNLNDRFLAVMRHFNLTNRDFASKLGVSQGVVSHISSGRNGPGADLLVQLLTVFPEIDPEWLILGNGQMLKRNIHALNKDNLIKVIQEIRLLNQLNYNNLNSRLDVLERQILSDWF